MYTCTRACMYVRVAVSDADRDNPSEEVEVATSGVIIQPLHVPLKNNNDTIKFITRKGNNTPCTCVASSLYPLF